MKSLLNFVFLILLVVGCATDTATTTFCENPFRDPLPVLRLFIKNKSTNLSVFASTTSTTGFKFSNLKIFINAATQITFDTTVLKGQGIIKTQQWIYIYQVNSKNLYIEYSPTDRDTLRVDSRQQKITCNGNEYENFSLDNIYRRDVAQNIDNQTGIYTIIR